MPSHLGFTFDGDGKEYETAPRRPMHAIVASIWYARNARTRARLWNALARQCAQNMRDSLTAVSGGAHTGIDAIADR